jgi:asparagine synthase (glutamine-hydrolysing)
MCGISGLIEWGSNSGKEAVRRMTEAIHHRGPDDEGYFSDQFGDTNLHFGFKRLSIIDLSESGHQPMVDDLLSKVIVFNGEIYNYREIRKELEVAGHTFRSGSDTEVILKSYSEWGASCLDRFIGMFAFVIYDSKNKKLFGARDRMGVKPFFYHLSDDRLIFCSELKGIKASGVLNLTLDMNSAGDYLKYGQSIGRRTK